MPVIDAIDANPEPRLMSLREFVEMGLQLRDGARFAVGIGNELVRLQDDLDDDEGWVKQNRFTKFMITGIHPDDDTQAYINLDDYRGTRSPEAYCLYQDYDSFIGISATLPYKRSLGLSASPYPSDTLITGVHIKHTIRLADGNVSGRVPFIT